MPTDLEKKIDVLMARLPALYKEWRKSQSEKRADSQAANEAYEG